MYTCLPVTLPAPDISCVTGRFCCYQDRNCIQVRDSSSVWTTPVVVYRVKPQCFSYGNRSDTYLLINRPFIDAENLILTHTLIIASWSVNGTSSRPFADLLVLSFALLFWIHLLSAANVLHYIAYCFVAVCLFVMLIRVIDSLLILQLFRWIIVTA